jgi:RNA polymerase sigma factor (sigma-70 family)
MEFNDRERLSKLAGKGLGVPPTQRHLTLQTEPMIAYAVREHVFRSCYEDLKKPFGTFLYHLLAHQQEVEDLYQETFKKFWEHLRSLPIHSLPTKEDAKKWLFTVARNQIIDQYRKQKKLSTEPFEETEQTLAAPGLLEDQLC